MTGNESQIRSDVSDARDDAMLAGEELALGYGDDRVIDGESLTVDPGSVTVLVGPNGSGKSTILKGLADQLTRRAGSVLLDGREITEYETKALAQRLGLLSQERTSPETLTVEDLVYHGRYPHRGFFDRPNDDDRRAVERALDLAGCAHLRDREVGSLSGGQKQLAWIAMALAQETDVLLLDEPTTFLDLHHQLEVLEIIEALRDESDVTVVVVLHDLEQAARLADHVVALRDGEIRTRGAPESVVTEDLLADVFAVDADVTWTERGPRITPIRARHDDDDGESAEHSVLEQPPN